jgi:peptide/nickel transport system permease protein
MIRTGKELRGQTAEQTDALAGLRASGAGETAKNPWRVYWRRLRRIRSAMVGLAIVLLVIVLAIGAPVVAPQDPNAVDATVVLQAPSWQHLLGTDELGRDQLSRIIWGARVSVQVGLISVSIALGLGVPTGLAAGFVGGWLDSLLMRITDAVWSFPTIILALAITTAFEPSLAVSFVAVGLVFAPTLVRLTRAQTMVVRKLDYVEATRALGASPLYIVARHILPNVATAILVQASILVAAAIIVEAGLSFLGLGVQPPTPAWGSMLRAGYPFLLTTVWPSLFPGLAIFVTVLGVNLFGDGLLQVLNPKQIARQ